MPDTDPTTDALWAACEAAPADPVRLLALADRLAELLDAYEDGTHQCHCTNSGHAAPAPCTPCRARAAIARARGGDR